MGKQGATGQRRLTPAPQNLANPTPNAPVGGAPFISPSSESSTRSALSGEGSHQSGCLGHSTRSETHARVSDTARALPSLSRPFGPVDFPPPRADVGPGVESLRASTLAALPDRPAASSRRVTALPVGDAQRIQPPLGVHNLTGLQPQVKVCVLCTGGDGIPVLPDTGLILQSLDRVPNIDVNHIITRTSRQIDVSLDKFADPTDIREGGILILILSCHGFRSHGGNVLLQFRTQDGTIVDSRLLQQKIMALPQHCTLEVVADTCCAEGVIPGLRRISTSDPSAPYCIPAGVVANSPVTYTPLSGSRLNTKISAFCLPSSAEPCTSFPVARWMKPASPLFEQGQPIYKAQVIVWAASTIQGKSYTEEDLPGKVGTYSILIGAIFNYLNSSGPNISRRDVWEHVLKVVEQHNDARHKRDLCKPLEVQANLVKANRVQRPILLTSVENVDRVLSGFLFQSMQVP